jgi:hypothetical protein
MNTEKWNSGIMEGWTENGMMEEWNDGIMRIPPYSNIPVFQHSNVSSV